MDQIIDDEMFPTIARLPGLLEAELAAAGGGSLCYSGLWVGDEAPWLGVADCAKGDCGVAWVRVAQVVPSEAFPMQDDAPSFKCGPLAYQLEIGVARCAPRPKGRDTHPSPQQLFEATRRYLSDAQAARRALLHRLPKVNAAAGGVRFKALVGEWNPLENAAGRSGGVWTAWIGADK